MSLWRSSPLEIAFRLRQEAMNLCLYLAPPTPALTADSPLAALPAPPIDALRGTAYAASIETLARGILAGRLPLLGTEVEIKGTIPWRRDPVHGQELGTDYFRKIPYLDFARAGDHKFIWELSRHQHLVVLAQAWCFDPRAEYLDAIAAQLKSWREANPFQCGMNWASALEVAFRAWSWIWIWHLCGAALPPADRAALLTSLYQHGCHLEYNLSIYFSPNTHVLGEAIVLHALGVLFPRWPSADRWRRVGGEETARQAARQVLGSGEHFELSNYYHVYALDMLMTYALLEYGEAGPLAPLLRRMAHYLHAVATPDRRIALTGDDDGGRWFHPYGQRRAFGRATLATAALLLNETKAWPYDDGDVAEQAAWWLGARVVGHSSPGAPAGPETFRASGIVRLGDGVRTHVLFDAGGFGPFCAGHSHSDALQVLLWSAGEEILIDPGTYTYISDPVWRDRFRGSAAHNTVRIDGLDQAAPAGPFAWNGRPDVRLESCSDSEAVAVCLANGFTHWRQVIVEPGPVLRVIDHVEGPPGDHDVELFWHLGDAAHAAWVRPPEGIVAETVEGWRSSALGHREPAAVLRCHRRGALPLWWETVIAGPS